MTPASLMLMQAHTVALCTSIPQHRGGTTSMSSLLPVRALEGALRWVTLPFVLRVATGDSLWFRNGAQAKLACRLKCPIGVCGLDPWHALVQPTSTPLSSVVVSWRIVSNLPKTLGEHFLHIALGCPSWYLVPRGCPRLCARFEEVPRGRRPSPTPFPAN